MPALWERLAHTATITSSIAACAALAASIYQFRENLRVQEATVALQAATLRVERASKAGELFDRYLAIRKETPDAKLSQEKRARFYIERNNRAILVLSALYSTTKGEEDWESIVFNALQRYAHNARERNIACEPLTEDFRSFMKLALPDATDKSMCSDYVDSN